MQQSKQERYDQLAAMPEDAQTREESTEQTQLYYELDPEAREIFRRLLPDMTPQEHFGIDTSKYL